MVAAGVPKLANRPDCIHFGAAGHVLGTKTTLRKEFTAYVPQSAAPRMADPTARTVRSRMSNSCRTGIAAPQYDAGSGNA